MASEPVPSPCSGARRATVWFTRIDAMGNGYGLEFVALQPSVRPLHWAEVPMYHADNALTLCPDDEVQGDDGADNALTWRESIFKNMSDQCHSMPIGPFLRNDYLFRISNIGSSEIKGKSASVLFDRRNQYIHFERGKQWTESRFSSVHRLAVERACLTLPMRDGDQPQRSRFLCLQVSFIFAKDVLIYAECKSLSLIMQYITHFWHFWARTPTHTKEVPIVACIHRRPSIYSNIP